MMTDQVRRVMESQMEDFKNEMKDPLFREATKAMSLIFFHIINDALDKMSEQVVVENGK